ncbi:anthranilate synthase component I family protein [Flammeovirgaceae bacterium SG7u.111]|nr:anthranilate synthase component I family protein [Flammeovirgaceae bacterium SG7u.132]WPO35288.1 anthranilate synthase component I family protein [Flammeovirgaceae bacterium SG7u.111]
MEKKEFDIGDSGFLQKALKWAQKSRFFAYFDHNHIPYPHEAFQRVMAVGAESLFLPERGEVFEQLDGYFNSVSGWKFGCWGYDLKNEIENLKSNNPAFHNFPQAFFFTPLTLIHFGEKSVTIEAENPQQVFDQIQQTATTPFTPLQKITFHQRTSRQRYLNRVEKIRQHIEEGDVYELNYCIEFFAENITLDPVETFLKLNQESPMPFAACLRINEQYLLCASPERFLKREGKQLVSQPIKGTARRGNSSEEDERLKNFLKNDEKERAENMMIVDLVRNDLTKSAQTGSIKVPELFGIYGFRQVHQMISTVTATLKKECSSVQAIKNAFPMGSMTGAPKIKAMQLIEELEDSRRGLFSGAVGYQSPDKNFDFNVVIRSLFYDAEKCKLSYQVGSAITYDSVPEKEYEECLLKAKAIMKVLDGKLL